MATARSESSRTQPGLVVIDAGHGGAAAKGSSSACGVRGPMGTLEKDVVLQLAHRVAAHVGADARLSRVDDQNLSLAERCEIARRYGARVFVSLHANEGPVGRRGAETYVHRRAGAPSRTLGRALQTELATLGGSALGSGELAVLSPEHLSPGTAACLLEVDFLSDQHGERRLRDPRTLDSLGRAIASGIRRYMGRAGAVPVVATAQDTFIHPVITRIFDLVDQSGLVEYQWLDRGRAPIGYLKGMALTYARVYCKYQLNPGEPENWRDRFVATMAEGKAANASPVTDAVAKYADRFLAFGADVSASGVAVLRGLFTVLFGLGMRESSGKPCVGWDHGKLNGWGDPSKAIAPTATNSEAGLFQMSFDIGVGVPGDFKDLYEKYQQRPDSGFLDFFSEGVACGAAEGADFGAGDGLAFQRFSKSCPAFTAELAALALRTRANHWGPINSNTVELKQEVWSLLLGVEQAVDDLSGCIAVD